MSPTAELDAACQRAIERLAAAAAESEVAGVKREAAAAEREIVLLRDGLITLIRAEPDMPRTGDARLGLDRVNAALSLVLGVEYPIGPLQRQPLESARDLLKAVLADNLR